MKKTINKKNTSSIKKVTVEKSNDDHISSVLEALPVGVIVYTLKNILFANKAAFELLKFDKKLISKINTLSIFDFLDKSYHKTVKENFTKIYKGTKVTPVIYKITNPKGETFYIETKSSILSFKGKKAIQAVFSDVTSRIKAEEELIDKQTTFRLLTENSSDIIFLYNYFPKEHYSYVSDSVKDILGYSPGDFYKDPAFIGKILVNPPKKKPAKSRFPKTSIQQFKRKDGSSVWLSTRYSVLKSHSNNTTTLVGISRDVSSEKDAISQLKASEEKFKIITQNVNDLIYFFTYQPKPKYLYVNPSVKNVLGYSDKDFYNNPNICNSIVVNKKEYKSIESRLAKQQKAGTLKRNTQVFQYISKSGKPIWLKDDYMPIFDENGKINYILGISRDITTEKLAEFELEQKWNDYKNLIENSPIGIFIHESGNCLYCNKTAANFLEEKNPAKILGKNLISFIVPEQQERAISRIRLASQGVEQNDLTYQVKTTKGNLIEVDLKTVPIIFKGKSCVQTIVYNLTAEKKLEKEIIRAEVAEDLNKQLIEEIKFRKKIQKELVSQSSKYEAIFNNTSHMVGTINRDFRMTSFNKNYFDFMKSMFDHDLKIGDHLKEISVTPEQRRVYDFWEGKLNNIFNNQKSETDFLEIKNVDSQNKPVYREIYIHPLKNTNGEIDEVAIIGHDVTERKLSEQKILEQTAKISAIFDSGEQLIWTINRAHRLTSFNHNFSEAMYQLYGIYPSSDGSKAFNPLKGTSHEHVHRWWITKYDEVFDTKAGIKFTVEQIDKTNKKHFRQVFISPIINNGNVTELSCISYDITELKYLQSESVKLEQKLTSIFESSSHLIWTVNRNFDVTSFNQNFSDTFESKYHVKPVLYCKLGDLLNAPQRQEYEGFWHDIYTQSFAGEKLKFERKETDSEGKINLYREVYVNPIKNQNGEIVELACLAHDITEAKNFEQQILNQSAKLKAIFESSSHLIWTVNKNFELTSHNSNYYSLVKANLERNKALNKPTVLIKDPDKQKFWLEKYNHVLLTGKHDLFIHKSINEENKEVYREIYLYPIYLDSHVSEVSVIAKDITERIHYEEQILKQSAKLKAIFESGNQLMWTINKKLELTSFNQNYANAIHDLYDFYPELNKGIRAMSQNQTKPFEPLWDEKYAIAFNGFPVEFTSERVLKNGNKVFRQYYLYPIKNSEGVVEEVSGLGFDITENKLNEAKIIQSLKEKEVLLKEVHHRVKNNMQVISSILNLQSSYVKDAYALNLLKECQNRIKTMAFIHESLYQTKNFESVNFSEYVTTLTKNLIHSYTINSQKIKLILTLDNLFLNLDTSIPCGLIINEIVSNSLKYAFTDNRDGIIFVNLKKDKEKVRIEAGDNGIGFPENLDIKATQTLGLQLVDTLIEQIGGTLKLDNSKGTKFIIEFKI